MKRLSIVIILTLTAFSAIGSQDSTKTEWQGKYFRYFTTNSSIGSVPLFSIPPHERPNTIQSRVEFLNKDHSLRDWTGFTIQFIEQVLKKHLTIEEIRQLKNEETQNAKAYIYFEFNYSGDILYAFFSWRKNVNHIFTDNKLYGIYQDFMKMKVDTEGFLWWVKGERHPTTEERERVVGSVSLPFFFKKNCP